MTHALPALLITLTALLTGGLVHTGYSFWWLSEHLFFRGDAASYDWTGALAVSGTAAMIVLITGLVGRRLVAGNTPPASTDQKTSTQAAPNRIAGHSGR